MIFTNKIKIDISENKCILSFDEIELSFELSDFFLEIMIELKVLNDNNKIILSNPFIQSNSEKNINTYLFLLDKKLIQISENKKNILLIEEYDKKTKKLDVNLQISKFNYDDNLPFIELYEYQIHNYEPTNRHKDYIKPESYNKFNDIDDSPLTECGRISIEGTIDNEPDSNRSTCDPIKSINGGGTCLIKYSPYDIDNLYYNYKTFLTKIGIDDFIDLYGNLDDDSVNKIINNCKQAYEIQSKILIHYNKNLEKYLKIINSIEFKSKEDTTKSELFDLFDEDFIKLQEQTALIYNLTVNSKHKIILFGDFHGSFHTFFRILCRLHRYGVINLETLEINEPYKIIFLGDIIDRGNFGLDILNIIFKLIIINNKDPKNIKIILNRGNHEEYNIYMQYGFIDEIMKKIKDDGDKNIDDKSKQEIIKTNRYQTYLLNMNILKLFAISFSAVIINQYNDATGHMNRIWCCHGGFPRYYCDNKLPDETIIFIEEMEHSIDIRWSDFYLNETIEYVFNNHRGAGAIYSYKGTNKFLKMNNINFIIRGHQDSINNSILFTKTDTIKINDPIQDNLDDILFYNNNKDARYINRRQGPIAKIRAHSHFCNDSIYPVLTISTNTDAGRDLNTDSFALLKFNNYDSIGFNNEQNGLNIINPIRNILKNSKINKESIIHTNLNKIMEILNLLKDNNILYYFKFDVEISEDIKKYIDSFIDIYDDCVDIGIYYEDKINQIIDKARFIKNNKLDNNDIQKGVYQKYINGFATLLDNYKKNNRKFNLSIKKVTKLVEVDDNHYKNIYDKIKIKFEEYWQYNDIDVWKYIRQQKN